jgi:probable rRNA maturation factor
VTPLQAEIEVQIEPDISNRLGYVVNEPGRLVDLVRFVLESESVSGHWSIVVVLTSDEHLRQLHKQFMGIDEETDVMTFPYDPDTDNSNQGGDIVISVDRAIENAVAYDLSPAQEVAFLAVHGTLHLCGWDDASPQDRGRMLNRQRSIIDTFDAEQREIATAAPPNRDGGQPN